MFCSSGLETGDLQGLRLTPRPCWPSFQAKRLQMDISFHPYTIPRMDRQGATPSRASVKLCSEPLLLRLSVLAGKTRGWSQSPTFPFVNPRTLGKIKPYTYVLKIIFIFTRIERYNQGIVFSRSIPQLPCSWLEFQWHSIT